MSAIQQIMVATAGNLVTYVSGAINLSIPSHAAGDMVVVYAGNQSSFPATVAGFTEILRLEASSRYISIQYKISNGAAMNLTGTYTYEAHFILRGATRIGAYASIASTLVDGEVPAITGLNTTGLSVIAGGNYTPSATTAPVPAPYTIINGLAIATGNKSPSLGSSALWTNASLVNPNPCWVVEFL